MKLPRLSFLFIAILVAVLIFFHSRGTVIHDEGYILNSSAKILEGQVPYKDFAFVYTPGSIYLTSLFFLIFSPSILASRILMILFSLFSAFLIFKIIKITTSNSFYAILSVLIFVSWGPAHINFSWPVMFSIPASLATIYLFVKHHENQKDYCLFLGGLLSFITFLTKQNFGFATIIPIAFYILFGKKIFQYQRFTLIINGYLWGVILFIIYLLLTDSFGPFIKDFYDYTITRILINSKLTTNFIYQDFIITMILRTLFYLIPAIISLWAIFLLILRKRYYLLFIPIFVLAFYFVGIRPTTDYVHLVPLMSLIGIPLSLIIRYSFSSLIRLILLFLFASMIVIGFHTALFKGYYRWDSPLLIHDQLVINDRINIFLNEKSSTVYQSLIFSIKKNSPENSYIFVSSYDPMIYFLSDRKEPVKNNILKAEIDEYVYYEEVIGSLIAKKIPLIVKRIDQSFPLSLENYIERNFMEVDRIAEFIILKRKIKML